MSEICAAVVKRVVIRFAYSGGLRTVEPYCHGISTTGSEMLLGFQVAGYSSSELSVGWRLFEMSKIRGLRVTTETFADRPDYDRNNVWTMSKIHCCV